MSGTITIDDLIALAFSRREAAKSKKKQEAKPKRREPAPVGKRDNRSPARTTIPSSQVKPQPTPPQRKTTPTSVEEEGSDLELNDNLKLDSGETDPTIGRTRKDPSVNEEDSELNLEGDLKIDPEEDRPGRTRINPKHKRIEEPQDELVVDEPLSVDEDEERGDGDEDKKVKREKKIPAKVVEDDEDVVEIEEDDEDPLQGEDAEGERTVKSFFEKFEKQLTQDAEAGKMTDLSGHSSHERFGEGQAKALIKSITKVVSPYFDSKNLEDVSRCSRSMYIALRSFGTSLKYLNDINSYLKKKTGHDYNLKQNFQDVIRAFVYFDMAQVLRWISGNIASQSDSLRPTIESLFKRFAALTSSVNVFLQNPAIAKLKLDPDGKIKPISIKSKNIRNSEILKLKKNVWRRRSKIEKIVPGSTKEIRKYEEYLEGFESSIKAFVKKEMENGGENSEETVKILKEMLSSLTTGGALYYISRESRIRKAIRDAQKILDDSVVEFKENRKKHMNEIKKIMEEKKLEDPTEARRELAKQKDRNKKEIEKAEATEKAKYLSATN